MKQLWKLVLRPDSSSALPILSRMRSLPPSNTVNGANVTELRFKTYNNESEHDYIDVIGDFSWTKSPKNARTDVPKMYIHERRILVNNQISNFAYSLYATLDGGASVFRQLSDAANVASGGLTQGAGDAIGQAGGDIVQKVVNALKESDTAKVILDNMEKIQQGLIPPQFNNPALQPYNGLYLTEATGFNYILPYLGNSYFESTASYGNGDSESAFTSLLEIPGQIANAAKSFAGIVKPGRYIEKARQYNFGENGRSITVKFPLLNTSSYDDIINNWQLLFALIYQNKPGRYDKNIIDLPVIYSIEIPGMVGIPYAFISNLNIEFMGTRRVMKLEPIPPIIADEKEVTKSISAIIPDAYQVTITFTGLNEETRNFLYAGLQQNQVTVTT